MRSFAATYVFPFVQRNWRVLFYVLLIIACVLLAPEEEMKFIYTEF